MPTPHLLTDTEKSSVPYKTPLKNHRERTILGVFVKLGVRTLIPVSHILTILPALENTTKSPHLRWANSSSPARRPGTPDMSVTQT